MHCDEFDINFHVFEEDKGACVYVPPVASLIFDEIAYQL